MRGNLVKTASFVGGAFVFYNSPSGLPDAPSWGLVSDQKDADLGISVGAAGDVNADGYDDVVIGASGYTNGETAEGQVLVYFGASSGLTTTNGWAFESAQAVARLGTSVSAAGDVNCDGWDDVIVGAPQYDNGETDEGAAFIFYGATGGISTTYTVLDSNQAEAEFGTSVSAAGDVNNDGCDDVIAGAPLYDGAEANEGAAVGAAGDVNRDGHDDVLVGAPFYTGDQNAEGAAFVYLGATSGIGASAAWHGEGDKSETAFGHAVGIAGDVNNDQRVDLIIGAPQYRNQTDIRGRAFVYTGSGTLAVLDKFVYYSERGRVCRRERGFRGTARQA